MARETKIILRCDRCGDVIGTYEPLVVVIDGEARQTSLAAEPDLASAVKSDGPSAAGEHFHRSCYAESEDDRGREPRPSPLGRA